MSNFFAGGHLNFIEGEWRDDNGDVVYITEVLHGEWVTKDCISISKRGRTIHYSTYKCSVCGKWHGRHKQNYCPNCGAKMKG